ncbi:uncharacterized protein LOC122392788 [Amphibalanus amphitrite]|uniref:uncharacterized protein LOC122392788 n=1 Tax=Amphibalanus amphitrite TaxID=1232801 RepID=UPI001C91C4B8|nr:uncharacterized protein LOC122392788 [Amphibalanus amphitrite]
MAMLTGRRRPRAVTVMWSEALNTVTLPGRRPPNAGTKMRPAGKQSPHSAPEPRTETALTASVHLARSTLSAATEVTPHMMTVAGKRKGRAVMDHSCQLDTMDTKMTMHGCQPISAVMETDTGQQPPLTAQAPLVEAANRTPALPGFQLPPVTLQEAPHTVATAGGRLLRNVTDPDTVGGPISAHERPPPGNSAQMATPGGHPCPAATAVKHDRAECRNSVDAKVTLNMSLTLGTYNCEGFLAGAQYIADCLIPECDILFLCETWLARAQGAYLEHALSSLSSEEFQVFQEFAMELPPGTGDGRPHGGVAFVCRRQVGRTFRAVECNDSRICGVTIVELSRPLITIIGCYMPYWNSSAVNFEEYTILTGKLDALFSSLRPSAPVVLVGDFNCALPPLSPELRPPGWHRLRGFSPLSLLMQDLLDDHGLTVAEFRFSQPVAYTYARADGQSHIDHIAVPQCLVPQVHDCRIVVPCVDNLSPHLPVLCSVVLPSASAGTSLDVSSPPLNMGSIHSEVLDWSCPEKLQIYLSSLDELIGACQLTNGATPDEIDEAITRCIHIAARIAGCSKSRRPPKPWWSPDVAVARDRTRFWHQIWVNCGRPTLSAVAQLCTKIVTGN